MRRGFFQPGLVSAPAPAGSFGRVAVSLVPVCYRKAAWKRD